MNPRTGPTFTRRGFIATGLVAAVTARSLAATLSQPRVSFRPRGIFIPDCGLAGETRADNVFPAHPNGLRLGRDRFLIVYATRGWRGTDDDRSIVYQVRADSYDGRVLKEGMLARARDDWDPFHEGARYKLSHGSPMAFGVPQGAVMGGRTPDHANLFVAKWYKYARKLSATGEVISGLETSDLTRRTVHVEWMQFRLNEAGDDLEVLQAPGPLRPKGAPLLPSGLPPPDNIVRNQGFAAVVPFNDSATEWVDMHTIYAGPTIPVVALKFKYDGASHRYEWSETSPPLFGPKWGAGSLEGTTSSSPFEASIVRLPKGDWAVCARTIGRSALWLRTDDPFGKAPGRIFSDVTADRPVVIAPVTAFRCADGTIRIFTGDKEASPYKKPRDPLYCWEVDPDRGFAQKNRQVIFDGRATLPQVRPEAYVMADMAKVLPHAGGRKQIILHRVRTHAIDHDVPGKAPALLPGEKVVQGIYSAEIEYDQPYPDTWVFRAQAEEKNQGNALL